MSEGGSDSDDGSDGSLDLGYDEYGERRTRYRYDPELHWRLFKLTLVAGAVLAVPFYCYYIASRPPPPVAGAIKVFYVDERSVIEFALFAPFVFAGFHWGYSQLVPKKGLYAGVVTILGATLTLAAGVMAAAFSLENYLMPRPRIVMTRDVLYCDRLTVRWSDITDMSFGETPRDHIRSAKLALRDGELSYCNIQQADEPPDAVYRQIRTMWRDPRP